MSLLPFPMLENVAQLFSFDRFMDLIGEGSFANVYKAIRREPLPQHNLPSNSPVALKVISKSKLDSDRAIRDVIKEVEIGRKLRHPGCVPVLEVLQSTTDIFIVMELVEGQELFELIRVAPKGKLPEAVCANITAQLLSVLEYLHTECRIVHRDLKPENVLISGEMDNPDNPLRVRVVDLGLAKYIGTSQRRGRLLAGSMSANRPSGDGTLGLAPRPSFDVRRSLSTASVDSLESTSSHATSPLMATPCGTLKYNAPEAIQSMVVNGGELQRTTKGDLVKREMYSVGIVVFVMLSGQLPFNAKSKTALYEQMYQGPNFSSARWASVSEKARHFVAALMDGDPSRRPTALAATQMPWMESQFANVNTSPNSSHQTSRADDDDNDNVAADLGRHALGEAFDAMNLDADDDRPTAGGNRNSQNKPPSLPSQHVPHQPFVAEIGPQTIPVEDD